MGAALSVGDALAGHQTRTTLNLLQQNLQQLVARQRLPDDRQRLGHVLASNQCCSVQPMTQYRQKFYSPGHYITDRVDKNVDI